MTTKEDGLQIKKDVVKTEKELLDEELLDTRRLHTELFEELLQVSTPITMSIVTRYFMNGYETEDMMQEAKVVLIESLNDYDKAIGMPFLKYYHMKLTNHFNMLVRREHADKRKVNLKASSLDSLMEEAGDYVRGTSCVLTNPENMVIAKEAYSEYINQLSRFEYNVYLLFMDGQTIERIAAVLGSSETKVMNAWYRCTLKFKNIMN